MTGTAAVALSSASGRLRGALVGLLLVVVMASCAPRPVLPIGAAGRPFTPAADERALWAQADREDAALRSRVRMYEDVLLDEYLARIAARLTPAAVRAAGGPALRVTVVRDPTLNAFALPNGAIYLHTGLLSCLDNEAQLAAILAHEMSHVVNRDALRVARRPPPGTAIPASAAAIGLAAASSGGDAPGEGPGTAALGRTAGAVLGLGLPLARVASIDGYGAEREGAADASGIAMLVEAGYDPREVPRVFARLDAAARERGRLETFYLGSPPRLAERADAAATLLRGRYGASAAPPGTGDTPEFGVRMRPVVLENAYEDIRVGRFALARAQLDRVLALTPDDPVAHLYYGDLHRLQAQRAVAPAARAAHARRARERYERAVALDPSLAQSHRQLGLLHYQERDAVRARAAFERYLTLQPDAADAARIREYLLQLDP